MQLHVAVPHPLGGIPTQPPNETEPNGKIPAYTLCEVGQMCFEQTYQYWGTHRILEQFFPAPVRNGKARKTLVT